MRYSTLEEVTVLVAAYERPRALVRFLESVWRYFPALKVVCVDNSREPLVTMEFWRANERRLNYIKADHDIGVAASRNIGMEQVKTEYVALMDDDFIFTEETRLDAWVELLDGVPQLGLVGGDLVYCSDPEDYRGAGRRTFMNKLILYEATPMRYEIAPIVPGLAPWEEHAGIRYCVNDYTFNFFLMRNIPEFRWDADYKISMEHIDFFIRLMKARRWKVATTPAVCAVHERTLDNSEFYQKQRRRNQAWGQFAKKTGIVNGLDQDACVAYDLERGSKIPLPQFIYEQVNRQNMKATVVAHKAAKTNPSPRMEA